MDVLITGGAGFVGTRLARELLARGELAGRASGGAISRLVLADQVAPPAALLADRRVEARTGPLLEQAAALRGEPFDLVFHLASAVSGECERDFELGLRSNLDSTRALLDALRATGNAPRLVFSSSIAVFGHDAGHPMPALMDDDTLPVPQTSYGTHKLMCEYLVADYTRKGFIDGRSVRLNTVTVRPGRPNGAASSFFSGIVREPIAGIDAVCPVSADVRHALSSPRRTVEGLVAIAEVPRERLGSRLALNLPALNVSVQQMLDALEAVAGRAVRERVRFEPDPEIARIVDGWPRAVASSRATALGLQAEPSFEHIVAAYIEDCAGDAAALRGLDG